MLQRQLMDTRGQQSAIIRSTLEFSYPETLSPLFTLLYAALVQLREKPIENNTSQNQLAVSVAAVKCLSLQEFSQQHTSDGASAIVPGDPSQGDRRGGGGGDSQTRLVRRNWMDIQEAVTQPQSTRSEHRHSQIYLGTECLVCSPCTTRLTMMVSKPRVLVAVQV